MFRRVRLVTNKDAKARLEGIAYREKGKNQGGKRPGGETSGSEQKGVMQ